MEIGTVIGERFEQIEALVDTGATYTWVPKQLLERIGVDPQEEWPFILADGQAVTYPIGSARVRLHGRTRLTVVVFGEPESEPLMGAVTLEEFGLAADPVHRRLIPVPGLLKRGGTWPSPEAGHLHDARRPCRTIRQLEAGSVTSPPSPASAAPLRRSAETPAGPAHGARLSVPDRFGRTDAPGRSVSPRAP